MRLTDFHCPAAPWSMLKSTSGRVSHFGGVPAIFGTWVCRSLEVPDWFPEGLKGDAEAHVGNQNPGRRRVVWESPNGCLRRRF